jgi:aryl-alcohol dehydrogenase-like predicted oxidoreductase
VKRRELGRSGILASEIGLGTMTFGSKVDEPSARKTLDKAFDAGVDFVDVAEIYPIPPEPKWAGRREKISLLPYSPIAGGVLSGKYQGGAWPADGRFSYYRTYDPRTQRMTKRFVNERTLAATERLSVLAACDDIWKEIRYPME